MFWSYFAKNKKIKIFVVVKRILKLTKNTFQFRHYWICRKRFRSNVKSCNVFFIWKTKIYQSLINWKFSRFATISKNIFIVNIFVIIRMINQLRVFIFNAIWFWTTQCICKIMLKWCIKFSFDLYCRNQNVCV